MGRTAVLRLTVHNDIEVHAQTVIQSSLGFSRAESAPERV